MKTHQLRKDSPLERPLDNVKLSINVMISTPDKMSSFLKDALF